MSPQSGLVRACDRASVKRAPCAGRHVARHAVSRWRAGTYEAPPPMQRTESQGMQLAHQERDARREGGRGRATAAASGRQDANQSGLQLAAEGEKAAQGSLRSRCSTRRADFSHHDERSHDSAPSHCHDPSGRHREPLPKGMPHALDALSAHAYARADPRVATPIRRRVTACPSRSSPCWARR